MGRAYPTSNFFYFFQDYFFKKFFFSFHLDGLFCVLRRCFVLVVYFIVCHICVEIWGISRRFMGYFNVFVDYRLMFLMFWLLKKHKNFHNVKKACKFVL